jgi:hypothetical protein
MLTDLAPYVARLDQNAEGNSIVFPIKTNREQWIHEVDNPAIEQR